MVLCTDTPISLGQPVAYMVPSVRVYFSSYFAGHRHVTHESYRMGTPFGRSTAHIHHSPQTAQCEAQSSCRHTIGVKPVYHFLWVTSIREPGTVTMRNSTGQLSVKATDPASSLNCHSLMRQLVQYSHNSAPWQFTENTNVQVLQPAQLSIRITIDMAHTAPPPSRAQATPDTTYRGSLREDKLDVFDVVEKNPCG